ncbi:uncharacterized protein LOC144242521 [Crocuta crocuta]
MPRKELEVSLGLSDPEMKAGRQEEVSGKLRGRAMMEFILKAASTSSVGCELSARTTEGPCNLVTGEDMDRKLGLGWPVQRTGHSIHPKFQRHGQKGPWEPRRNQSVSARTREKIWNRVGSRLAVSHLGALS